ncbi:AraC family transcriptional regulator [Desulfogranum japonicum]|uniref:AraC family transcriptional regulator n=1 Tax=Desulfogranum japonicum TaxID=231447 RepID=UPI0004253743|nr:AraC family transcriptional regulator [Desulfogranum japonicum]
MKTYNQTLEQDLHSLDTLQLSLIEKMHRLTRDNRGNPTTAYPSLFLFRQEEPLERTGYMQEPSLCLVAQGRKRVVLGEDEYIYDEHHYLLTSIDLPLLAEIFDASPQRPYLGITLKLERKIIAQMMLENEIPTTSTESAVTDRGMLVSQLSVPILRAILRLLELLDHPEDIPVLAPLIQREILYRLLTSEQGQRLRQISMIGSHSQLIARAIGWLKENYDKTIKIDDLAAYTGMSSSSLHQHFRAMTAMSPLQFQKRLRLNEARKIMFMEQMDATTAAFQVGYASPSQFSREYSRLFGSPPSQDIKSLLEKDSLKYLTKA